MSRIRRSVSSRLGTTNGLGRVEGVVSFSRRLFAARLPEDASESDAESDKNDRSSDVFRAAFAAAHLCLTDSYAARSSARRARPASIARRVSAEKSSATLFLVRLVVDAFFFFSRTGDFGDARVSASLVRASSGSGSSSISSRRVRRARVEDERKGEGEGDERRRRLASVGVPRRSAFSPSAFLVSESVARLERVFFAAAGVRAAARVNSAAAAAAPASASRAATSAADAE